MYGNHSFSYEVRNGIGVKRQSQFVLQLLVGTTGYKESHKDRQKICPKFPVSQNTMKWTLEILMLDHQLSYLHIFKRNLIFMVLFGKCSSMYFDIIQSLTITNVPFVICTRLVGGRAFLWLIIILFL